MLVSAAAAAVAMTGCGGQRQDAHDPTGNYTVSVLHASFPAVQHISQPERLVLVVRNDSNKTVPNLAVTIDSFNAASDAPDLASRQRPVWIVDRGPGAQATHPIEGVVADSPGGYQTAYVNTWAAGPVRPHRQRIFSWRVTPVQSGIRRVTYTVAAGLNGKAHAQLANGQVPRGSFIVAVSARPAQVHVDPNTGKVVPGPPPQGPAS